MIRGFLQICKIQFAQFKMYSSKNSNKIHEDKYNVKISGFVTKKVVLQRM